jgi:putative SOS response-associated peptidase YedK
MCGRFSFVATLADIQDWLPALNLAIPPAPRYNIAPSQPILTLLNDGTCHGDYTQWGLVPEWAKSPSDFNPLINARAETVQEKPAFRSAFKYRRCLIPASGFYEWKKKGSQRQPYYFSTRDQHPFAIAGLWETWHDKEGGLLQTCAIITTAANDTVRPIHQRMPVILPRSDFMRWLDPRQKPADLLALLQPAPNNLLRSHPVSTRVNSTQPEGPDLVKPLPPQPTQADFFQN